MSRYSADPVMAGLKDFQRATVEHVTERFFGANPTRRFLVADETGLGKSLVARGVIAKTLEYLQDDDTVGRIDVVYVCSNQDIAAQNVARLKVTTGESVTLSSRLTLLAKHSRRLDTAAGIEGKPVNLVAFTPGTSFDQGWRIGKAEERAMLFLILERTRGWDGWNRRAAVRALQGAVAKPERFEAEIERLRAHLSDGIDGEIMDKFLRVAGGRGLLDEFDALLAQIGRRSSLPRALKDGCYRLIGELRLALAQSGVQRLEPDLVILDEFQRFRHLLDPEGGEAAELAHHLFNYGDAKVLLLSATPYKPFTLAEESELGEDHHRDFRRTLEFLNPDPAWNRDVGDAFAAYREAVVHGQDARQPRAVLRQTLLQVMSRTERPAAAEADMLDPRPPDPVEVRPSGVNGYVALHRLAKAVDAPLTIEYWKSAPYFLNFTDGYQLGDKLRAALREGGTAALDEVLRNAQVIDTEAIRSFKPVEPGNARLRRLAEGTVDRGWWQLLWVPPSMPHYALGEPFASARSEGMTKRLLFSSWNATPTAVAGLLSYEAERRIAEGRVSRNDAAERRRMATRLEFRLDGERPAAMNTLALFWPHPPLAALGDPLHAARRRPDMVVPLASVEREVQQAVAEEAASEAWVPPHTGEASAWESYFRWAGGGLPAGLSHTDAIEALSGRASDEADETPTRLARHVEQALSVAASRDEGAAGLGENTADDVTALAMHAPGNVAWRALGRLLGPDSKVTVAGHWKAAAVLASGLRSLFNRVEATLLLDRLELDRVYWRAVLRYCALGGLQAVLDEYVHHLRSTMSDGPTDDDGLLRLAEAAAGTLSLRPSTYRAFDPDDPGTPIPLLSRFALRYGGRRDDPESARHPEIRAAFNSPFWPFVLATTSAGQEGIDFHWWCSAVVHWNTPANPVDFEQREGRVHRFGGHAIRRNVAARHRAEALRSSDDDVWRAAYAAARSASDELGDFAPYWVYPGPAKIVRQVMPYPLSRDEPRLRQLERDLALYRLAFGQPRQEDMLELLRRNGVTDRQVDEFALDLRPPSPPDS